MIGIKGQYVVQFTIGDKVDFISTEQIENFNIIETAGNALPEFELIFNHSDEELFKYFNEGNDLKVSVGVEQSELSDIKLAITKWECTRIGDSLRRFTLMGLYSALDYISDTKIKISDRLSGIEVMNTVAGLHFTQQFGVSASTESQYWIQHNITDKKYINDIWFKSNLVNSFIAIGISIDGKFILEDVKAKLKQEPDWKMVTTDPQNDKELLYDGDYAIISNSGFINHWAGYGRKKIVYDIEEDTYEDSQEDAAAITASKLWRSSKVADRYSVPTVINDNVHANYWKADLRNRTNLAVFSSIKLRFTFHGKYVPMRVLDLVSFRDEKDELPNESVEYHSGSYLITKVARNVSNQEFSTTVEVSREALNDIKGDLK
tara:strand:- start:848 stop:1975 length:1128 start_codon:yes stop_codon:yes gene_type:complete